jgi:sodium/proline symporter
VTRAQAVFATLLAYNILLIGIGLWASRRTGDDTDFYLGGRKLGPWVTAISASASSSSAWTLLGVSGAAYSWGLSALWLFPATVSGFLINWLWVGPRLMRESRADGSVTLTEFLAGEAGGAMRAAIVRLSSLAIIFAFTFYIASQFQGAGLAFASSFGLPAGGAIAIGAGIIVAYTLMGGFWAVSVTDLVQGLLMVAAAILLPLAALSAAGGFGELAEGLRRTAGEHGASLTREYRGLLGLAFVLGTLGIGLGYPGQPHVVNRFMAARDQETIRRGRIIAIGWAVLIYTGMLLMGLCARTLWTTVPAGEQVLFHAANTLLPPVFSGIMVAAVLSAIMSTADSQLLVASSSLSWDLRLAGGPAPAGATSLSRTRLVVVGVSLVAMLLAIFAPAAIFTRVLFAWHALGSAFGPVLLLKLAGRRIAPPFVLLSIAAGFFLTIVFYLLPDTPGDWMERLLPFAAALLIAGASRK